MKHTGSTLALVVNAICLCAPVGQAHGQQLVSDLNAYNIQVDYYAPRDPSLQPLYQRLKNRKVLEELGQFLAPLKWPKTLRLLAKQCPDSGVPRPEVFYNPTEYSVTVCYQLFTKSLEPAANTTQVGGANAGFAIPREVLVGGLVGTVLHEAARAAFDMLQVPVLGSDEDAADQFAGLVALQFGNDVAETVIKGTYVLWSQYEYELRQNDVPYNFASASGVAQQRAYNILCIAYGGRPATFKQFVDKGLLPASRAGDCANEYRQAANAFDQTIKPRVDSAMMHKLLTMTWITPDDLK